jgi:hypothetical protein
MNPLSQFLNDAARFISESRTCEEDGLSFKWRSQKDDHISYIEISFILASRCTKLKKMKISFEKGGEFEALLFEDKAPKTVKHIWDFLPIDGRPDHMRWAGRGLSQKMPNLPKPYPPRENQISIVGEGYLMFRADWVGGHESQVPSIILFYGPEIPRNPGDIYGVRLNWIGRIREDLAGLEKVGERIYAEGREKVKYEKAQ